MADLNKIETLRPFRRFCMTIGALPTTYLHSLSYLEMLTWFCEYLEKTVIPTINNNAESVMELQDLFIKLRSFVENYFDDLDVQEEINNKLDEMAENGTLQEIITSYLSSQAIFGYNNVEALQKASNLIDGSFARTLGFYAINDGGNALYKIRTITNEDNFDNSTLIPLENQNLVAELIIENNTINIKQLGARPQDSQNNKFDITPYLKIYLDFLDKIENRTRLYIPSGIWYCSGFNLAREKGFDIFGDFGFSVDNADGTIITSLTDNQNSVLEIGNTKNYTKNFSFKNIILSTADFAFDNNNNCFKYSNVKKISSAVLNMLYATFGELSLFFTRISGKAFNITSCWELNFETVNFRVIDNLDDCIWDFSDRILTLNPNANITACTFKNIMFEAVRGDLIHFSDNCSVANCYFDSINFEDYKLSSLGTGLYTNFSDENIQTFDENAAIHKSIFKIEGNVNFDVGSIQINNFSSWYYTLNNNNYVFDTIFNFLKNYLWLTINVNQLSISGMLKNARVIKTYSDLLVYNKSDFNINSISNYSDKILWLDINKQTNFIKNISNLKSYQLNNVLPFNFTPFYKIVNSVNMLGTIQHDPDSINYLNLVYTITKFTSPCHCAYLGGNLIIRAKIPEGKTATIGIVKDNSSSASNHSFVGTGNFEYYKIENISNFLNPGDLFHFVFVDSSDADFCFLDVLAFI